MRVLRLPLCAVALFLALPCVCRAQTPAAANAPGAATPAPHTEAPDSGITLKVTTKLTIEDVTVTDAKGKPVHGLTRADFTVKEDGKPQPISNFEEFETDRSQATQTVQPPHPLPPGIYSNVQPATAPVGAPNFLLLDSLNVPPRYRAVAQQQAVKYLKDLPPGTQVGILQLGVSGVRIVQGLTTDRDILVAAMGSIVPEPTGGIHVVRHDFPPPGVPLSAEAGEVCNILNARSQDTTIALNAIANFLSGIKGKKNLIWFTTGLPQISFYGVLRAQLYFNPSEMDPPGGPDLEDYTERLQRSYALLAAAQVAVSPIDPRGLTGIPDDNDGPQPVNNRAYDRLGHLSMEEMAAATGGAAFYNRNDLDAAIGAAMGTDYYSISYVPPPAKYDGKYHKIEVKVDRPGLTLHYREGYVALDTASAQKELAATSAPRPATPPVSEFRAAMEHGALPSTDLQFGVKITPSTEPTKPGDPVAGLLNPALKGKPLQRYDLAFTVPADQIALADAGEGSLEINAVVYGQDGMKLNVLRETVNFTLKGNNPSRSFQTALHLDLPPGKLFVRTGVQDVRSRKMGTLEVPQTVSGK